MKLCKSVFRLLALVLTLLLLPLPSSYALTVEQAKELLEQYYIDELPAEALTHTTVEELVRSLGDPYTQYLTAEEYQAFMNTMRDPAVVGIGVSLSIGEEGCRILTVYPNTPASEAGLQTGDLILSVDGVSLSSVTDGSLLIRGDAGTPVTLTVQSQNGFTRTIQLIRRQVVIPQTTGSLVDGHIGYVTCATFGDETYDHFRNIIKQYDYSANVWIIDLRGNSGGVTQAAVNAAACFAGNSIMSYFCDREGRSSICIPDVDEVALTSAPAIVLVDSITASASELLAGALRDYGRGIIIGSRTYGKGIAQVMLDNTYFPDYFPLGDALKVTTYRFFAPYCGTSDKLGVIPTLLVDDAYTAQAALLLSAQQPEDSKGNYRLELAGMEFFIDGKQATSPEYIDAFRELLFAIPPACTFYRGTGGQTWMTCSPEDTALLETDSLDCRTFSDVQSSPYRSAIQTLAVYGIAEPISGDQFQPEAALTRGQFCQMIARLMNCIPTRSSPFSDVTPGTELSQAVDTLYSLNLIQGYGDGTFRPNAEISHQEFLTVLARTAAFLELNASYYYGMDSDVLPLDDELFSGYASWARRGVWLNYYLNILWDSPSAIAPEAPTTREEAASTLYNLLYFCRFIPPTF